ncbi:MAG: DUF937 domain-containing protein [Clostridiales bacterium]|nr:DUF937 domain-containing protein [Clostridiales bacterium]
MDLVNSLLKKMTDASAVSSLADQTGGSDAQIEQAIRTAIPKLLNSMTKNASTEDGAKSLLGALGQHKNTDPIASQIKNADKADGSKIISKILGGDKDDFIKALSGESGLDNDQASSVLSSIAPALMSSVSAANNGKEERAAGTGAADFFKSLFLDDDDREVLAQNNGSSLLDILKKTIL